MIDAPQITQLVARHGAATRPRWEAEMETNASASTRPRAARIGSTILSVLPVLFLLFDAVLHLVRPAPVVEAFTRLGYAPSLSRPIGVLELVCLAAYVWPRTAVLGAILWTGYLGGATATQVRVGDPWFVFPVVLGILLWGGLYLRDGRLRVLIPFRS